MYSNKDSHTILSIVIPHYNVAPYVDCLYRTLFPQITHEVELILIDDASTDETRRVMQIWQTANTHPNIVFHFLEHNVGLSEARNRGTTLASGEYVWFIDSDDSIEEDAVSRIVATIKHYRTDAVVFDFFRFYDNGNACNDEIKYSLEQPHNPLQVTRSKYRSLPNNTRIEGGEQLLRSLFDDAQLYVCFYVVKRTFWRAFPFPKESAYEDIAVMPKIMYALDSLVYMDSALYFYRQRTTSIVNAPNSRYALHMPENMQTIDNYFQDKHLSESTQVSLFTFYLRMLRLSYDRLDAHALLSDKIKNIHRLHETAFLDALPWPYWVFLLKMRIYLRFRITSMLFICCKPVYRLLRKFTGSNDGKD